MQLDNHHIKHEMYYHKKNKSLRRGLFVFFIFVLVMGAIFISTVYPAIDITGYSIGAKGASSTDDLVSVRTSISVPEMSLKNEYSELTVVLDKGSSMLIDGKSFTFPESNRRVTFTNFSGVIEFDKNKIKILKGRASEIVLTGIPITMNKKKIDFELVSESDYKLIEIKDDFYSKVLRYNSSGEIYVEEDLIKVNSEEVIFNNYFGDLKVEDRALHLDGKVKSIEISGRNKRIMISN